MSDSLQLQLTADQYEHLVDLIKAKGLWDEGRKSVIDTLKQPIPFVGEFSDIYGYISSIIKDSPLVNIDTKFWFGAAGAINGDDASVASVNYIRGSTQYGLQFRGKLDGYTQAQIDAGIQRTSNYIGQNVISQILKDHGIPSFTKMLSYDIGAAILTPLPDPHFEQDAGGWGGTFYFWGEQLNYGLNRPRVNVGDAVLNGLSADDMPETNGVKGTPQAASLPEFMYANTQAAADAAITNLKNAAIGAQMLVPGYPLFDYLVNSGSAFETGLKAAKESWEAISAGAKAQTPASIRFELLADTAIEVAGRVLTGHLNTGPQASAGAATSSSDATSTLSGNLLKVVYSNGDEIDENLAMDGGTPSGHWVDADGASGDISIALDENGALTESDTWEDRFGAGSTGTDVYNADGSSSGKINYASGGYATYMEDTQGNVTTDYYTKSGNLYSVSWTHADGSSGSSTFFSNGLTVTPNSSSGFTVAQSDYETLVNPDGSYSVSSYDPKDILHLTQIDAQGVAAAQTDTAGDGVDYDQTNNTSSVVTKDGGTVTSYQDEQGHLTHDSWTASDGTTGTDTYSASGEASGKTVNLDGSTDTFSLHGTPGGSYSEFVASSQVKFLVPGPLDLTRDHINAQGTLASDTWTLSDAASGQDSFSSDGSGSGVMTHADGSTSTVTLDGSGGITVDNQGSNGGVVSQDWWKADGTHGVKTYTDGVLTATYDYQINGQVVVTDLAADGTVTEQQTQPTGALLNPDGAGFGKVVNSDGSYSVNYNDSNGDALIFKYSAGGQLQGTDHVSASRSAEGAFEGTLADGTAWSSPYNGRTPVVTDSDGTKHTYYLNSSGVETGDDWIKPDGTYGSDTYKPDGSSSGDSFNTDGTSSGYAKDGHGRIDEEFFAADGTETGDVWQSADGAHGSDSYNADGSSSGSSYSADGTRLVYTDDGQDNSVQAEYSASGAFLQGSWQNSDGSGGDAINSTDGSYSRDTYNADGSGAGQTTHADGSFSVYSTTSDGVVTTAYFDAQGNETRGLVENPDGSSSLTVYNTDGSTSVTAQDGAGNVTTTQYSVAGVTTGETWTHSDGTSGTNTFTTNNSATEVLQDGNGRTTTIVFVNGKPASDTWTTTDGTTGADTFNGDGSSTGTSQNTDGSSSSYVNDGQGNATTLLFNAQGVKTGDTWVKADGSSGADTFGTDGSSSGQSTRADGSSTHYTSDGQGNSTTTQFSTAGVKTSDTWQQADGSHGKDTFSADGSSVGLAMSLDGTTRRITKDASGNVTSDTIVGQGPDNLQIQQLEGAYAQSLSNELNAAQAYTLAQSYPWESHAGDPVYKTVANDFTVQLVNSDASVIQAASPQDQVSSTTETRTVTTTSLDSTTTGTTNYRLIVGDNFTSQFSSGQTLPAGAVLIYGPTTYSSLGGSTGGEQQLLGIQVPNGTSYTTTTQLVTTTQTVITNVASVSGSIEEINAGTGNQTIYLGGGQNIINATADDAYVGPNHTAAADVNQLQSERAYFPPINTPFLYKTSGTGSFINASGFGDTVLGTTGDDTIVAGPGNDILNGGGGADTYLVFPNSTPAWDIIDDTGYFDPHTLTSSSVESQAGDNYAPGGYMSDYVMNEPQDVVAFEGGVTVSQLQFSWGISASAGGQPALNISWGGSGGISVIVPSADWRALGEGVEAFTFEDGTQLTMDQMLALAPPQPDSSQPLSGTVPLDAAVGYGYTWSEATLADGSVEAKFDYTYTDGSSYSTDRVTQSDGSFQESWTKSDGSHGTRTDDNKGNWTTNSYGTDGAVVGSTVRVTDETGGVTTSSFTQLDGSGLKLGDTWSHTDGSFGNDTFNADGSSSGQTTHADGSYRTYTGDGHGTLVTSDYDANGVGTGSTVDVTDSEGNFITTSFAQANGAGFKLSDNWTKVDGSYGDDAFNADGSSIGDANNSDGSYSTYVENAQGVRTTTYFDVDGEETGSTIGYLNAAGNRVTNLYDASGTVVGSTVQTTDVSGAITTIMYAALDGSGATTGSTIRHVDATGAVITDSFDAGGNALGSTVQTADASGTTTVTSYSGLDGGGTRLKDSWTQADGSSGSDTYNADGSYTSTTNDSDRKTTADYASNGLLLDDAWTAGYGSSGNHTYNADGSVNSSQASGSYLRLNVAAGERATVSGTENTVTAASGSTVSLSGEGNVLTAGANTSITVSGTGSDADTLYVNNDQSGDTTPSGGAGTSGITVQSNAVVNLIGSGNSVTLTGNNTLWVTGQDNVITATDSTIFFEGDSSGDQVIGTNSTAEYFNGIAQETRSDSFDASGHLARIQEFSDGYLASVTNFSNGVRTDTAIYDASGTETAEELFDATGTQTDHLVLDSDGQVTQDQQFSGGNVVRVINATDGVVTDEAFYNASQVETADAVFNASGEETEYKTFDASGQIVQDLQFSADHVASALNYSSGIETDEATYNASGVETGDAILNASGVQTDYLVLDASGQVTQDQQFSNEHVVDAINFSNGVETDEAFYNASQQEAADVTFDASGNETAYTTYDPSGQVTQIQKFSDGHVAEVDNYSNGIKTDAAFYDAAGHETAAAIFNASGIQSDHVLFDTNGQVAQDQQFNGGYVVDAINYSLGVATDEAFFNTAGQQTSDTVFTTSAPGPAAITTSVNQLIQAMASFAPPAAVYSNMAAANSQQLHAPTLAVSH